MSGVTFHYIPAIAAATTLRKIALLKLTMISFLCSCMATWRMAKREKKVRQATLTMALIPATISHAEMKNKIDIEKFKR